MTSPSSTPTLSSDDLAASADTAKDTHDSASSHLVHIELFAGILTATHALQTLDMDSSRTTTLYSECGHRLLDQARKRHPEAHCLSEITSLIEPSSSRPSSIKLIDDILALLESKSLVGSSSPRSGVKHLKFLVTAGFPCQDLSRARKGKSLGLLGSRSCLIAAVTQILTALKHEFSESEVAFLVENVSSMDPHWRRLLDRALGVDSVDIDIACCSPCRRRRLIWTNIAGFEQLKEAPVLSSSCVLPGWTPVHLTDLAPSHRPELHRWDTFLRSRGPGEPPELPLQLRTLSPFAYHAHNLVVRSNISEAEKLIVESRLKEGEALEPHKYSMANRGKLIQWIHKEGGDALLRPLCGAERMVALGFPEVHSQVGGMALPALPPIPFSQEDWDLVDDTGNCFPLPAIKQALEPVVAHFKTGTPLRLTRWKINTPTWSSFFTNLGLSVPPVPSPANSMRGQGARR